MAEKSDKGVLRVEEREIIKEIFSNLSDIKGEVLNYYDNEFESTPISVQNKDELLQVQIASNSFQAICPGLTNNDSSQKLINCNKIILGSKPNTVSEEEDELEKPVKTYPNKDVYFANGSKLNGVSIDENYFEELVTSYKPNVVLQDIHCYLYKSKRFCETCSILFPEPNGYNSHMQIFHPEKRLAEIPYKESNLNERRQHKCTVCNKLFAAAHVVRRHLINIHNLNNSVIPNTTQEENEEAADDITKPTSATIIEDTGNESDVRLIENSMNDNFERIIVNNVNETNTRPIEDISKEPAMDHAKTGDYTQKEPKVIKNVINANTQNMNHVDLSPGWSNTCFHCKKTFDTQKSLIEHLYDILQMKRKNTEIVPVLKSVLFKCHKCDINFTSSQLAANHAEHMEMLINWKCSICNRIFKKEDELSHERQHSVSNNFLVYNLGDIDVANLLFRCSKCATHFTESSFLYHFRDCGLEVTKSVNCDICNILLDYNLKTLHDSDKHTESKLFTIIQCDVISDNPVKSTLNKTQAKDKLKELLKSFREVKIVLPRIDSNKRNMSRSNVPLKLLIDNKTSTKCRPTRLSTIKKRDVASRRYRKNYNIKLDMLQVLNNKTLVNIKDANVHLKRRNLTYSYCETCKCFVTTFRKAVHVQKRCKTLGKFAVTCDQCGLVLTSASIVTHRRLHEENKKLKLKNFSFFDLSNGRSTNPPIPEYPKCAECGVHFLSKTARNNHTCREEVYQTCVLCEMKFSKTAFELHTGFHQYATDRDDIITAKNSQSEMTMEIEKGSNNAHTSKTTNNDVKLLKSSRHVAKTRSTGISQLMNQSRRYKMHNRIRPDALPVINKKIHEITADRLSVKRRNLIYYYCDTCKCFITKFKKAIHIQGHCKNFAEFSETCKYCGLVLTRTSIHTHKRLHEDYKGLELINFKFIDLHNGQSINPPIPEYPKCAQCTVHFLTKTARANHICNEEEYQTCNFCEIKLSKAAHKHHLSFHRYETDPTKSITPNNSQVVIDVDVGKHVNTTENDMELHNPLEQTEKRPRRKQCKFNSKLKLYELQLINKTRVVNIPDQLALKKDNYTYSYCGTCNCFITRFRKTVHVQGRCKYLAESARTCKDCGLVLTKNSFATHRNLHRNNKNLELKNFKFIHLRNGRSVNPSIPRYPKCADCSVHFLTKSSMQDHNCHEVTYVTCHICESKLSKVAFKLHLAFHQYAKDRHEKVSSKNLQSKITLERENKANNDDELLHKNSVDVWRSAAIVDINTEIEPDDSHDTSKTRINSAHQLVAKKSNPTYSYCETCKCFITKFKKTVHLQGMCKNLVDYADTCKRCGLIFTQTSLLTHKRLHEEYGKLKLKNFNFVDIHNGRSINPPIPEYPKCATCSVHFLTKLAKNKHICNGEDITTCHICEIKLSKAAFKRHLTFHQYATEHTQSLMRVKSKISRPAVTLDTDKGTNKYSETNIAEKGSESTQNLLDMANTPPTTTKEHRDRISRYTKDNRIKVNTLQATKSYIRKSTLIFSYCATCKCFITRYRKDIHIQERCKNLTIIVNTCKHCGLVLSNTSIMTHKRLHEANRDIKLKNFKFFDLHSGRPMNPPIPEYPKCADCAVHFLTKTSMNNHICREIKYEVCHLCDIKLSESAFKCHLTFHQYATDRIKTVTSKDSQFIQRCTNYENLTDNFDSEIELVHNVTKSNEIQSNENATENKDIELINDSNDMTESQISQLNIGNRATNENVTCNTDNEMGLINFISDMNETQISQSDIKKCTANENATEKTDYQIELINDLADRTETQNLHFNIETRITNENTICSTETDTKLIHNDVTETRNWSDNCDIIYTCRNCSVSVDTYDRVVQHCQSHYENESQNIQTENCNICELTIDSTCYANHQKLHENGRKFKSLKFDSYYLPVENNMWVKHIFKTLPSEKVLDILRNSIYWLECRIKMEVIQQGDPKLTVYKCDQCKCFIEPGSLFKHSENSCFKLRRHPCTVCGIPYNSSESRIKHEKIHYLPGITMDSYRIVLFNRERDKQVNRSFCMRKNYVLYQCRNCGTIIDKAQENHQCDFNNVKRCTHCALLLHTNDYDKHLNTHKDFVSFNYNNIKVILLGEENSPKAQSVNTLKSNFRGAVYDYKMYVCNKCEICIKNEQLIPNHVCYFGKQRLKCSKCGLYFSAGRLKTHTRSHEQDPDFIRSNMKIVSFDSCTLDLNKNAKIIYNKDSELSDGNTDSDQEILAATNKSMYYAAENIETTSEIVEAETVKVFKCTCELHFLNEDSIIRHFGVCRSKSRISEQKCPKCDLLFTPNVLFTHLLAHHSKNSRRYKYDIIEMDPIQRNTL